jgi:hypothetical protein
MTLRKQCRDCKKIRICNANDLCFTCWKKIRKNIRPDILRREFENEYYLGDMFGLIYKKRNKK